MPRTNIAPASPAADAEKRALRERLLTVRGQLSTAEHAAASDAIGSALLQLLAARDAGVLAAFWPIRAEPDLLTAWHALTDAGWTLVLPVVVERAAPLEFRRWDGAAPEALDRIGLRVPAVSAPRLQPDAIALPCVGVSPGGHRLGYGGGYYDRTLPTLSKRPWLIGISFEAQRADFPDEAHDLQLDALVTERGAHRFR